MYDKKKIIKKKPLALNRKINTLYALLALLVNVVWSRPDSVAGKPFSTLYT